MPRHRSTPELRDYQWRRFYEERDKATANRKAIREKYNIKEAQAIMRSLGVKKASSQASQVWGCPTYYDGYQITLHDDGPIIEFHNVKLEVIQEIGRKLQEGGVEVRDVYDGANRQRGREPKIYLKDLR